MPQPTIAPLVDAIGTLLESEDRPEARQTAMAWRALAHDPLAEPCADRAPFDTDMRALLAAFDHIPWGANPVAAQSGGLGAIYLVSNLLGEGALIPLPGLRMGLFYQLPGTYYPLHDHLADETYFILGGSAHWTAGDETRWRRPGDAIHHPSLTPHAFRTGREGLLALWRWSGDVAPDSYRILDDPLVPLAV